MKRRAILTLLMTLTMMTAKVAAVESAGNAVVIACFGDSTTAAKRSYCAVLSELYPRFQVHNCGIGGNTTAMARERFERDVLSLEPDLVIVQFGINDAAVDVWKSPPATASRVALDDYLENLRYFVTALQQRGAEVILMTPNQVRWAPRTLELYGKPPYDPDDPLGFTHILAGYAEGMRRLAAELNVPIVDVYAMYDDPALTPEDFKRLLPDGMHPSFEGHRKTAAALQPHIDSWLTSRPSGDTPESHEGGTGSIR